MSDEYENILNDRECTYQLLSSFAKAGCVIFQHMFSTMNEMLDHIIEQYPCANEIQKDEFHQQLLELKHASDLCIEQWLQFEEKWTCFAESQNSCQAVEMDEHMQQSSKSDTVSSSISANQIAQDYQFSQTNSTLTWDAESALHKGKGYYNLFMFSEAADQFSQVIRLAPESNMARLFLGMSMMHMQQWHEAQRQFQLLIVLTDYPKWLALGYNALGCIQAIERNLSLAEQFFRKAYDVYPQFAHSLNNLEACLSQPKQLSLYFGSTELCCL